MIQFDAVVVLGKEMRHEPERAMRELRARAAAAAAVHRATGATIATLEARLRGQARTGSQIVADLLSELGVSSTAVYREDQTRSTREEVARTLDLTAARSWKRILVVTARYHIPRVRRLFTDEIGATGRRAPLADRGDQRACIHVAVHGPPAVLRCASEVERSWILAGEPSDATMRQECRAELVLSTLARAIQPLPFRRELEVQAGAWLRGAAER